MYFADRSALFALCLAISVQALPVTYSVVDVDGGSAAAAANGATDSPAATVYQTVTKSTEVDVPEATTVSVSITVVETKHASVKSVDVSPSSSSPTSSSTSSSSSLKASAQASSSAGIPSATATGTSVLESAKSTFLTRPTSTRSTPSTKSTITQAPTTTSASYVSHTESDCDCEVSSVTVTAEASDAEQTVTTTKGETVVLLATTTVTPAASSTSYYDDGMWHTRYAIKPAPSSEAEKPSLSSEDVALQTNPAVNGTSHARRNVEPIVATPTVPVTSSIDAAEGSGAALVLVQPLRAEPLDIAVGAKPTGNVDAMPEVLAAEGSLAAQYLARRASTYSVVSWNETTQG
jgi:hypothetical protein